MDGEERQPALDLMRLGRLVSEPERFHVLKALRLIEAAFADHPRLGRSRKPAQDPVRLSQWPELAFPPSTIQDFQVPEDGGTPVLVNRFFGLWGPHGALPLHLTEYARDRQRNHHDTAFVAFADVFHHRMLSLFYRAWAAAEPAPSYDRDDDDPFGQRVAAIAGLKGPAMADRDAMPDNVKRAFAGRLAHATKNEDGLLAVISSFFSAPVSIESFVGSYLHLDRMDIFEFPGVRPRHRLGRSVTVGDRVWSRQAKFRIRIGPLSLAAYHRLLPGGQSLERLRAVVNNYVGAALDWDANLVLAAEEVPAMRLGREGELGWTTWIGRRPAGVDADELMVGPAQMAEANQ